MMASKKIPKTAPPRMAGISHHALIMMHTSRIFVLAQWADLTAFRYRITAYRAPVDHPITSVEV